MATITSFFAEWMGCFQFNVEPPKKCPQTSARKTSQSAEPGRSCCRLRKWHLDSSPYGPRLTHNRYACMQNFWWRNISIGARTALYLAAMKIIFRVGHFNKELEWPIFRMSMVCNAIPILCMCKYRTWSLCTLFIAWFDCYVLPGGQPHTSLSSE